MTSSKYESFLVYVDTYFDQPTYSWVGYSLMSGHVILNSNKICNFKRLQILLDIKKLMLISFS